VCPFNLTIFGTKKLPGGTLTNMGPGNNSQHAGHAKKEYLHVAQTTKNVSHKNIVEDASNEDFASANIDHDDSDKEEEGDSQLEEIRLLLRKQGGAYSLLRGKFEVVLNNANNAEQGLYAIRAMDKLSSDLMTMGFKTSGLQQSLDGTAPLPASYKKQGAGRERPLSSPVKKKQNS
jgi:hypothetical protein